MIFYILLACTDTKTIDTASSLPTNVNLVLTTVAMDYSVGALATFDTETETVTENISSISGDPVIIMDGGWLWQLNRYQYDTLRKYNPDNLQVPVGEVSLAPEIGSSNPHDVAVCGDSLVVSLYGQDYLALLDPDTLETIGTIDISEWADEDGIPEASSMVVVDDQLYVGLQRLDRNAAFAPQESIILQIDCETYSVNETWTVGHNIELIEWNDTVAVVTQSVGNSDAGVLVFDIDVEDSEWTRVWSTNSTMSATTHLDGQLFYSALSPDQTEYIVHCVDLESERHSISEPWSEYITDLVIEDDRTGWLGAHWGWSGVGNSEPGLYKVDLETCGVTTYWAMELAPFSILSL